MPFVPLEIWQHILEWATYVPGSLCPDAEILDHLTAASPVDGIFALLDMVCVTNIGRSEDPWLQTDTSSASAKRDTLLVCLCCTNPYLKVEKVSWTPYIIAYNDLARKTMQSGHPTCARLGGIRVVSTYAYAMASRGDSYSNDLDASLVCRIFQYFPRLSIAVFIGTHWSRVTNRRGYLRRTARN